MSVAGALVMLFEILGGWLAFLCLLVGLGEAISRVRGRRRGVRDFDALEAVWALPPAERRNDRGRA